MSADPEVTRPEQDRQASSPSSTMPQSPFLHASRRRERQARRTVTLITAVVATHWICADLAAAALIARRRAS